MKLTKKEKELIKAHRLGAKIHIEHFHVQSYEEAMILLKGSKIRRITDLTDGIAFSTGHYTEDIRKTVFLDK